MRGIVHSSVFLALFIASHFSSIVVLTRVFFHPIKTLHPFAYRREVTPSTLAASHYLRRFPYPLGLLFLRIKPFYYP